MNVVSNYKNLKLTVMVSFMSSFLLSPLSNGIVYFFIFLYLFEIVLFLSKRKWRSFNSVYITSRFSIVMASFLGWWLGRMIVEDSKPHKQVLDTYDLRKYFFR